MVFTACFAVVVLAIVTWAAGDADQGARTISVYPNAARRELDAQLRNQARTYRAERRELEAQARASRSEPRIVISADAAERAAVGSSGSEPDFLSGSRRVPTE